LGSKGWGKVTYSRIGKGGEKREGFSHTRSSASDRGKNGGKAESRGRKRKEALFSGVCGKTRNTIKGRRE